MFKDTRKEKTPLGLLLSSLCVNVFQNSILSMQPKRYPTLANLLAQREQVSDFISGGAVEHDAGV